MCSVTLLVLIQYMLFAEAAPILPELPLSLNPNSSAINFCSSFFTLSQSTIPGLTTAFNSSLTTDGIRHYRVPGTHTILRIAIKDEPISPENLCRTITYTRSELRDFIDEHEAEDHPLTVTDDPYQSSRQWTGCFFGVATVPPNAHHLTYGIVQDVLLGLWNYLFRAKVYREAVFEVLNDRFGTMRTVGVGKITPRRLEARRQA